jgi:hypothetical protein
MNQYKFTKPNISRSFKKEYATLEEAQAFADSYDGGGWNIEDLGEVPKPSTSEKLRMNKAFGVLLEDAFLEDNMEFMIYDPTSEKANDEGYRHINPYESMALGTKFKNVSFLLSKGDIKSVKEIFDQNLIATDTIFTQERKDKYTQMITDYLNSL